MSATEKARKKPLLSSSKKKFREAIKFIPGGVNSPVRAFRAVGGSPIFIERGRGSKIFDMDGNCYIDYVMSWGALILGHTNSKVLKKIKEEIDKGTSFGVPTPKEVEFARIICKAISSIERLRLVNSGTEATMSAIRVARGFTKKDRIIKFEGCYHGSVDSLLVKAGSGAATFGVPTSLGIPPSLAKETIVCPYNDIDCFYRIVKKYHKRIACCIVEPICGNMGVVLPKENFLFSLREITAKYRIILIFDEVITGFRFCFGGVQNIFKIKPDLTCLGKIIGGGLPIGAYGGKREIMECVAPQGGVYQAGTLSGNPLAVSAGLATLETLSKMDYKELEDKADKFTRELERVLRNKKVSFCLNRFGSMFTLFFAKEKVVDFKTAKASDTKKYAHFFWSMVNKGIYFAPSQFEANFLSFSHTKEDIQNTAKALTKYILEM
jgi:glutamate-1-semialdehyde 2,1-aminomutase